MTIINGHILTYEEENERKELLSDWYNEPGTEYAVTASGILAPIPKNPADRHQFMQDNLHVDGANDNYREFLDALGE
jgi:hypothetical protein